MYKPRSIDRLKKNSFSPLDDKFENKELLVNAITDIQLSAIPDVLKGAKKIKLSDSTYLFYRYNDQEEPITHIKILYNNSPAGKYYRKIKFDINRQGHTQVYLAIKRKKGGIPIINIRLLEQKEYFPCLGFIKIPRALNPDSLFPRQYLAYQPRQTNEYWSVGDQIDALDTAHQYVVAKIEATKKKTYFITYLGWPRKWDEWVEKNSPRLLPLGTMTSGKWTGHKPKSPFRLEDNIDEFQIIIDHLKTIVANVRVKGGLNEEDLKYLENRKTTDLIRDVLDTHIENMNTNIMDMIQQYLQTHLLLIIHLLTIDLTRPMDLLKLFAEQNFLYSDLYRTIIEYDHPVKFPSKMLSGVLLMLGSENSCFYYPSYKNVIFRLEQKYAKRRDESIKTSMYLIDNINFFGIQGGFKAITQRIIWISKHKITPIELKDLSMMLRLLVQLLKKEVFDENFKKVFCQKLPLQSLMIQVFKKETMRIPKMENIWEKKFYYFRFLLGITLKEKEVNKIIENLKFP